MKNDPFGRDKKITSSNYADNLYIRQKSIPTYGIKLNKPQDF